MRVLLPQIERDIHGDGGPSSPSSAPATAAAVVCRRRAPCSEVRRYAVVALTNLTFGNQNIKSFLCSSAGFVPAMVRQLGDASSPDGLRKATAHLFRNLAWKADRASKQVRSSSSVWGAYYLLLSQNDLLPLACTIHATSLSPSPFSANAMKVSPLMNFEF